MGAVQTIIKCTIPKSYTLGDRLLTKAWSGRTKNAKEETCGREIDSNCLALCPIAGLQHVALPAFLGASIGLDYKHVFLAATSLHSVISRDKTDFLVILETKQTACCPY
jgi:hypothetical protein